MQRMVCLQALDYPPSQSHKPGDVFEVEDRHVRVLQVTGKAKLPDTGMPEPGLQVIAQQLAQNAAPEVRVKRKYTKRVKH